jgi:hypothetical protein
MRSSLLVQATGEHEANYRLNWMSLLNFIKQSCVEYTSTCAGIELDTVMETVTDDKGRSTISRIKLYITE